MPIELLIFVSLLGWVSDGFCLDTADLVMATINRGRFVCQQRIIALDPRSVQIFKGSTKLLTAK